MQKRKSIASFNLDEDVLEMLELCCGKNRSQYLNKLLKKHFLTIGLVPKQEDITITNRIKNFDIILNRIDDLKHVKYLSLESRMTYELGIKKSTFREYVELLAFNRKIVSQNGWLVSFNYTGPKPWTYEFSEQSTKDKWQLKLTHDQIVMQNKEVKV